MLTAAEAMGQLSAPAGSEAPAVPARRCRTLGCAPPAPDQDLRGVVAVVGACADRRSTSIGPGDATGGPVHRRVVGVDPGNRRNDRTGLSLRCARAHGHRRASCWLCLPIRPPRTGRSTALVDVVNEAMALARLRAVRPQDLQGLGLVLPGIFLSNNFKQDVPTVDLRKMIESNLSVLRAGQWTEQRRELHENGRRNHDALRIGVGVMAFRVSATAAGITSLAAIIAKPDPSATTWSRLEPLPTSDDVSEALQARVADPLWMLARQWQFNEFQGEDAGSPIEAALRITGVPITSLVGTGVPAVALAGAAPIEALVEREQVLAVHPKLNAQAGQQLMRQLRAAGLNGALTELLERFSSGD